MTSTADPALALAATLQRAWDAETAAVYADLLTARGDPQGEQIAIDLALATAPTPELHARKRELLASWLGPRTLDRWRWRPRHFQYGLLRRCVVDLPAAATMLERILDDLGDRLGGLVLRATEPELVAALATLARRPLPWLTTLGLERTTGTSAIDDRVWHAVVAATPNLRELAITGTAVARTPIHPQISTLRLDGGGGLVVGRHPAPSVVTLDLAIGDGDPATLAALVNPRTFPALRVLDLGRNEGVDVYRLLDAIEQPDRLDRIRVPSIGRAPVFWQVRDLLARLPRVRIEVARMFLTRPEVAHPRLTVPPRRPWPHPVSADQVLVIDGRWEVGLAGLIGDLEQQFDAMDDVARDAWRAFWRWFEPPRQRSFPAETLQCALDAIDGNPGVESVAWALGTTERTSSELVIDVVTA